MVLQACEEAKYTLDLELERQSSKHPWCAHATATVWRRFAPSCRVNEVVPEAVVRQQGCYPRKSANLPVVVP